MKERAKRNFLITGVCILGIVSLVAVLNIKVSSRQGINFVVHTIKAPLYIKIIEFFDRDYHYKELVKRVCRKCSSDKDKVLVLFEWTHQNIKRDIPEGWPIVDDHVWHIIVRGYGARDQFSDVFTTLCNYAGVDAFFTWVYTPDRAKRIPLSFVKIREKWTIFDPYHGVYFKDEQGRLADIETIKSKNVWLTERLDKEKPIINYAIYFNNLPSIKRMELGRSNIQSPLRRTLFEVKGWLKVK